MRGLRALGHACYLVDVPGLYRRLGRWAGPYIRWRVDRFGADMVLLTRYAADLDDLTLEATLRGRDATFWFFDLVDRPHPRVVRLGRAARSMFVTCPSQIELYAAAGVSRVQFLPQAIDPAFDSPAPLAPKRFHCDVSFVGSGQYPYRHELLRAIDQVCDLQIRGPGWDGGLGLPVVSGPVRGSRFAQVVRGAAICLGANAVAHQWSARACTSNRLWKILGCGGFYLGPRVPDADILARGGVHCVWYDSTRDAVDLTRQYLADPSARRAIAEAGRTYALSSQTYMHRLALLLEGQAYPL
jgi:glycosyl transferase family 1/uncharacterized protein DUF3880